LQARIVHENMIQTDRQHVAFMGNFEDVGCDNESDMGNEECGTLDSFILISTCPARLLFVTGGNGEIGLSTSQELCKLLQR